MLPPVSRFPFHVTTDDRTDMGRVSQKNQGSFGISFGLQNSRQGITSIAAKTDAWTDMGRVYGASVLFLLMFIGMSFAVQWQYPDAEGQLCFNVVSSSSIKGLETDTFYGIMNLSFTTNDAFWNYSTRAYNPAAGRDIDVFNYANGTSTAYVLMPVVNTLFSTPEQYCIYSGSSAWNSLSGMAPYNIGFQNGDLSGLTMAGSLNATQNGTEVIINSTTKGGYHSTAAATVMNPGGMWVKFRPISGTAGSLLHNSLAITSGTFNATGAGIGLWKNTNISGVWYNTTAKIVAPANYSSNIYRLTSAATGTDKANVSMWLTDGSFVNKTSYSTTTLAYTIDGSYPVYVDNGSAAYEWGIVGMMEAANYFTTSAVAYDYMDANIVFLSPTWLSSQDINDPISYDVAFVSNYDNCTLYMNGVSEIVSGAITSGDHMTGQLATTNAASGANNLTVSCYSSGVETHKYTYFVRAGANADTLFNSAFGFTVSGLGCTGDVEAELGKCTESYNLTKYYDFAAVVCPNLNQSKDWSCVGVSNVTSGVYTIFYRPDTFSAADGTAGHGAGVQHTGANFIYYGSTLHPGFELFSNDTFMYMPAYAGNNRTCDVRWTASTCAWAHGFILNQGVVVLSDRGDNWFTAGGAGMSIYDDNVSQLVGPVQIYSILQAPNHMFEDGIYKRLNCFVQNSTFKIRIQNTLPHNYTVQYFTNTTSYVVNINDSVNVYYDLPTSSLLNAHVYSNNGTELCAYIGGTSMFLPFAMPDISLGGGFNILVTALMLFSVVLTAMIPFGVIVPIIFNDIYHILSTSDLALVCMMSVIFGFVNAAFNVERGVKHMLIILGLATAYLAAISPYASDAGLPVTGFDSTMDSFTNLATSATNGDISNFVLGIPGFIIALFTLVLLLPITFMNFMGLMLNSLSPTMWTAAQRFWPYITVGMVLYFYIKTYEVLANRFRPV